MFTYVIASVPAALITKTAFTITSSLLRNWGLSYKLLNTLLMACKSRYGKQLHVMTFMSSAYLGPTLRIIISAL